MNTRFHVVHNFKIFACIIAFLCTVKTISGQKTDKVYLKNGDVITGEIKNLYLGLLTFDMTGPGKISIKWEEVKGLKSDKIFEITLRQGQVTVRRLTAHFFLNIRSAWMILLNSNE